VRIVWSPQSLRDLDAIDESIAKDSEHLAGLTVARIFSAVERLSSSPGLEINCLKWQQSLGRQENFRQNSD
jgi:plasmid stabilization system protein ParE